MLEGLAQLARDSKVIARGRVEKVFPGQEAIDPPTGDQIIYTDTQIGVARFYKGVAANPLIIRALGGETSNLSMSVSHQVNLTPEDQDFFMFLSKDTGNRFKLADNEYTIQGWDRGIWRVRENIVFNGHREMPIPDFEFLITKV